MDSIFKKVFSDSMTGTQSWTPGGIETEGSNSRLDPLSVVHRGTYDRSFQKSLLRETGFQYVIHSSHVRERILRPMTLAQK
jgi:hypothetical protein